MKTLTQTLTNYVAACFSGLWIETFEPDEAIREITALCKENQWHLATSTRSSSIRPAAWDKSRR